MENESAEPLFAKKPKAAKPAKAPKEGEGVVGAPSMGKTGIIILSVVGGLLVLVGLIIATIFIAGNSGLTCEQKQEYSGGAYKQTATINFGYFFGNLKSISMVEETWSKEAIPDSEFESAKSANESTYGNKDKFDSWNITKVDDNTIRLEAEVKITDENAKNFKTIEDAKKYAEERSYTCK